MSEVQVKTIDPAALSPKGAAQYLSITPRAVYNLIADRKLVARKLGSRTLIDFDSVRRFYEGLPVKTVAASVPNSPQSLGARPRPRGKTVRL